MKKKKTTIKQLKKDPRFLNILGFLVAKRLLTTNMKDLKLKPTIKLDITDCVWAGNEVEPRILEVLPAALIHFPKTFYNTNKLPTRLLEIINLIKKGENKGPDFQGLKYKDMKIWANHPLLDKRTKPQKNKKIPKIFRLDPTISKKLELSAKKTGKTQTKILEELINEL